MEQYTLIGQPLGHSMSPFIHERLFSMAGREASYTLTDIAPEHLEGKEPYLRSLQGFNITIPHKMAIIPIVDELDESAKRYNSVNCVANQNGKLIGYNTDCDGFTMSVKEYPMDGKVLLIGCGGVGRMIATEALRHGANHWHYPAGQGAGGSVHSGGKTDHAGSQGDLCCHCGHSRQV